MAEPEILTVWGDPDLLPQEHSVLDRRPATIELVGCTFRSTRTTVPPGLVWVLEISYARGGRHQPAVRRAVSSLPANIQSALGDLKAWIEGQLSTHLGFPTE